MRWKWKTVEYTADAATEGRKKGLIVIGHVPSEQAGMEECARWLKTFVKEVPIEFVATKQPFWIAGTGQDARSISAFTPLGSTRGRFPGMPPPVMCARAETQPRATMFLSAGA